jgi:hypothetical protein
MRFHTGRSRRRRHNTTRRRRGGIRSNPNYKF